MNNLLLDMPPEAGLAHGRTELTVREKVWLQAWTSTANANDCKSPAIATNYADACLYAFDCTFPMYRK